MVSAKAGEKSLIGKAIVVNRNGRAKVDLSKEILLIDHESIFDKCDQNYSSRGAAQLANNISHCKFHITYNSSKQITNMEP